MKAIIFFFALLTSIWTLVTFAVTILDLYIYKKDDPWDLLKLTIFTTIFWTAFYYL